MNVSYEAYRTFYYTAKYRSFTQAAEVLQTSQPNVSRAIKNLEQALGCALLIRSNRQVLLTEEGAALYRHVSAAFEHLLAGEEELARGRSLEHGVLRVAVTEIALRAFLLPVLKQFRSAHPGVHIKLMNGSTPSAAEALRGGLADLAVVTVGGRVPPELREAELAQVRDIPICGSAYAHLAGQPRSLAELRQYPLISLGDTTQAFSWYRELFASRGLPFDPEIEAATADLILPLVKANLGIGFVPDSFLQGEALHTAVFPLTLEEPLPPRRVSLLLPAERPIGPTALAFRQLCLSRRTQNFIP